MTTIFFQHELFQRLGWGLLHSIWQIAALAAVYYFGRLAISKRHVRFRYHFGYAVLLAMFVAPVVTMFLVTPVGLSPVSTAVSVPEPQNPEKRYSAEIVSLEEFMAAIPPGAKIEEVTLHPDETQESADTASQNESRWRARLTQQLPYCLPVLAACWFCGVIVLSCRMLSGLWSIRKLRLSGKTLPDESWQTRLAELCRRLNVKANVRLLGSKLVDSPVLIGIVRPVILVPLSLLTWFTPEEIEAILVHELAHVRRHDYLANLVQLVLETLLFYHPLFWRVSNAVRDDREFLCDDFVVDRGGTNSLVYAKTLERLEHFRQIGDKEMKRMLFTPAAAAKPLLNRIRRILKKRESDRTCGWLAGLTLFLTLTLTPLALALFNGDEEKEKPKNEPPVATFQPDLGVRVLTGTNVPTNVPETAPKQPEASSQTVQQVLSSTPGQIRVNTITNSAGTTPTPQQPSSQQSPSPKSFGGVAIGNPTMPSGFSSNPGQQAAPTIQGPIPSNNAPLFLQANPGQSSYTPNPQVQQYMQTPIGATYGGYGGPSPVMVIGKRATKKPTGPISSKLYPCNDVLQLFSMEEFFNYLRNRLEMEMLDGPYQIFPTQKNALIVTSTGEVHEIMEKIMDDLRSTIGENREFLKEKEVMIKVIPVKYARAVNLTVPLATFCQNITVSCDPHTNSLILGGKSSDLSLAEMLIQRLDAEPTKEKESGKGITPPMLLPSTDK